MLKLNSVLKKYEKEFENGYSLNNIYKEYFYKFDMSLEIPDIDMENYQFEEGDEKLKIYFFPGDANENYEDINNFKNSHSIITQDDIENIKKTSDAGIFISRISKKYFDEFKDTKATKDVEIINNSSSESDNIPENSFSIGNSNEYDNSITDVEEPNNSIGNSNEYDNFIGNSNEYDNSIGNSNEYDNSIGNSNEYDNSMTDIEEPDNNSTGEYTNVIASFRDSFFSEPSSLSNNLDDSKKFYGTDYNKNIDKDHKVKYKKNEESFSNKKCKKSKLVDQINKKEKIIREKENENKKYNKKELLRDKIKKYGN